MALFARLARSAVAGPDGGPRRVGAAVIALALCASLSAQDEQPPVFRAGTELIAIDVSVVDDDGYPVPTLRRDDFSVSVDGTPRAVVTAEFIRHTPALPQAVAAGDLPFSTNETASGGRLVLLVFDTPSLAPDVIQGVTRAAAEFLDELSPADRVGLLAFPGAVHVDFTADHGLVRKTLQKVGGRELSGSQYRLGLSEAYDIDRGEGLALKRAVERECGSEDEVGMQLCVQMLLSEARVMTIEGEQRALTSLRALRATLDELRKLDVPKTVIWVSQGLPLMPGRSDISGLSAAAAAARTTIHAVHIDRSHVIDVTRRSMATMLMADRRLELSGLEVITSVSRGGVFGSSGSGSDAFSRIARRMTGYYLLSVETTEADRDGRAHEISVSVAHRDLDVRARRTFAVEKAAEPAPIAVQVAELLRSPLIATELPLKVATHNLREPGDSKLRVIVSSEIGRAFTGPVRAAVGYLVTTAAGEVVATSYQNRPLHPRAGGGAPAQAVGMLAVPPGRYTLRLAVIDQDGRRGSVEHRFDAAVDAVGPTEIADLLLFPAVTDRNPELHPATDITLRALPYEAYLEVYPEGESLSEAAVAIEVAGEANGPALRSAQGRLDKEGARLIARGPLPLARLPPGDYVARVVLTAGGITVRQTHPFRIADSLAADPGFAPLPAGIPHRANRCLHALSHTGTDRSRVPA